MIVYAKSQSLMMMNLEFFQFRKDTLKLEQKMKLPKFVWLGNRVVME